MAKVVKKRNWAFVLYPESAPADWKERIQLSGVMSAVSPLHDKDVNADKTPKKAHYHVILVYGSPTTYNNVKNFTDSLNQPIPQALEQVRGYYRYLTHKDNPDKYQYSESEITTINGFDIAEYVEMTKSEVLAIKQELTNLIREKDIIEYQDFMDYISDNLDKSRFDVASSNTIYFNTYIKSKRFNASRMTMQVDPETGEVIK